MDDLFNIAVDEIALEGVEGVSAANLWKLLEANPVTARLLDDTSKAALLASLRRAPGLTFQAGPLGTQGNEADVIVASEELRRAALGCHAPVHTALSALEQKTLELLGKARHKGAFQSTLSTVLNQHKNAYHYVVKCLDIRGMLSRRNIILRPVESRRPARQFSHFSRTYLLRLTRFTDRTCVDNSKLFAAEWGPGEAGGGSEGVAMNDPAGSAAAGLGVHDGSAMGERTSGGGRLDAGDATCDPLFAGAEGGGRCGGEIGAGNASGGATPGGGGAADPLGSWDMVSLADWVPDAKARVCKQLRDAPGQVLLESDVKRVFNFLGVGGHRNWRRLRAAMIHDGSVEHFVGSKKGKPVFCLRLKKDAKDVGGPRGLVAEKPLEEQAFDIIDSSGAKGIFLSEMWHQLGVRPKANRAILDSLIRRGLVIASMDHDGKIATRMLYSCRYPPQPWAATVGNV